MTYLRDGFEHLYEDEAKVYDAIKSLTVARRTGNNSQIARITGISNTRVGQLTLDLASRGFIHNTSKGAAYHWRVTAQPVPYGIVARQHDRELARRQRELNEGIRAGAPVPGTKLADMTPDQRRAATERALGKFQAELEAAAPEISRIMNEAGTGPAPAPHGWEVKTFDGQRLVGIGTFDDEQVARDIARGHREHGFTTRVRPASAYGETSCCDSCT